jgi:hypothetical protein
MEAIGPLTKMNASLTTSLRYRVSLAEVSESRDWILLNLAGNIYKHGQECDNEIAERTYSEGRGPPS